MVVSVLKSINLINCFIFHAELGLNALLSFAFKPFAHITYMHTYTHTYLLLEVLCESNSNWRCSARLVMCCAGLNRSIWKWLNEMWHKWQKWKNSKIVSFLLVVIHTWSITKWVVNLVLTSLVHLHLITRSSTYFPVSFWSMLQLSCGFQNRCFTLYLCFMMAFESFYWQMQTLVFILCFFQVRSMVWIGN